MMPDASLGLDGVLEQRRTLFGRLYSVCPLVVERFDLSRRNCSAVGSVSIATATSELPMWRVVAVERKRIVICKFIYA
jgi:hypothetical protein